MDITCIVSIQNHNAMNVRKVTKCTYTVEQLRIVLVQSEISSKSKLDSNSSVRLIKKTAIVTLTLIFLV
jgi:hypothetical protein